MWTLALGDAIARFLLTYIIPKRYGDRIRKNVEPAPTYLLATGQVIVPDKPRMTLIEGVFATILFDLALFGTDNILINGIIRFFTKLQNGWDRPFTSQSDARQQITTFSNALNIQTYPWIWEKPIEQYACINDFFSRRYDRKHMPKLGNADVVAPACCTMQMYESDVHMSKMLIKGCEYSLDKIGLPHSYCGSNTHSSTPDIDKYASNHVFLGYLSPTDYHRVHSPVAGKCVHCRLEGIGSLSSSVKFFGGKFNILNENTRLVIAIEVDINNGQKMRVALIVVGGVGVNTIVYDPQMEGKVIAKGGEVATFRAGGSAFAMFTTRPLSLTQEYGIAAKHSREVKGMVGESIANFC